MKYTAPVSLLIVALYAFAVAGCGSNTAKPTDSSTPTADADHADADHADADHGDADHGDHADADHGDHAHGDHGDHGGQTDMEKMKAELAKLSPEDAASAKKQHICPVTGEMLGTGGAPEKVDVNGQQVWICCDDCKDKLLANPDKYLAKLKR